MKYSVTNDGQKIASSFNSLQEFLVELQQQYPEAQLHQGLTVEQIRENELFGNRQYLLNNDNVFALCEKYTKTLEGYLYNSYVPDVKVLSEWKLNSYEVKVPQQVEYDGENHTSSLVREFNLDTMVQYPCINIIGQRGCGKTTLISTILDKQDEEFLKYSLIITPNNKYYTQKYPNTKVLSNLNIDIVVDYINMLNPGAIVFDDCLQINNGWYDAIVNNLLTNGKCYNKMIITTMQYPMGFSHIKNPFDYVFIFSGHSEASKNVLYQYYATIFPDFYSFKETLNALVDPHRYSSMVIDKSERNSGGYDKIYKCRARL